VKGDGPKDAQIMLVGEAPGLDELVAGRGFVGRAGWVLDVGMKAAGMAREVCYVSNVVKCMPSVPGKPDQFRKPSRREVAYCAERWLQQELEEVRPNVVVALGESALSWLARQGVVDKGTVRPLGEVKMTEWRGTVLEVVD
jgi:DNA polymerase